jgi:hypothetical protein
MNNYLRTLTGLGLVLIVQACYRPDPSLATKDTPRLDIPTNVKEAVLKSLSEKDEFSKKVMRNEGQTESIFFGDSATLFQDMEFLVKYDITKPAYDGVYEITETEERGTQRMVFIPKQGASPDIEYFSYQMAGGRLLEALWEVREKNMVLHSRRFFSVRFDTTTTPSSLLGYDIDIGQKIIAQDSTWYKISVNKID